MQIGKPQREIFVEPLEIPEPCREPAPLPEVAPMEQPSAPELEPAKV